MAILNSQSKSPMEPSAANGLPYVRPVLTVLFNVSGLLTIVLGFLYVIFGLQSRGTYFNAAFSLFGLMVSAMLQFGIAQVINFVGQIAYNTARL